MYKWSTHNYFDVKSRLYKDWTVKYTRLWLTVPAVLVVTTTYHCISITFPLFLSLLSVLHLSLDFRSIYSLHFAYASPQHHLSPSPPVRKEWGSSSRWTEVGLGRSGGGSKGWTGTAENWPEEILSDGWPKNDARRARRKKREGGMMGSHHFISLLSGFLIVKAITHSESTPLPPRTVFPFLFVCSLS